tara:strand:- start:152 stop:373 length:222 start_codon:yes stop_codon:yes gene_type:complete
VNSKEGNLLSFKILVDETGNIVTEISGLPLNKTKSIFKNNDLIIINKILSVARPKLEQLHNYIEDELDAIVTI